ncbi:MAG: class I SAM-dependent methyltransferase [Rhodospirillales bacterium]|nr:class I SAM-dependent methyltransferase [Rhodospirillales bacterium]
MTPELESLVRALPSDARVLDVGCLGWTVAALRPELRHAGCDIEEPDKIPEGAEFRVVDLREGPLPFEDDRFDLVVASHVIEHLPNPIPAFGEMLRVCRPGGLVYVEAPSDRSALYSWGGRQDRAFIFSFYDDPTHVGRPWTPQALYRLALYHGCEPVSAAYDAERLGWLKLPPRLIMAALRGDDDAIVDAWWKAVGWSCHLVCRKPASARGRLPFRYFSLKGARDRLPENGRPRCAQAGA